ncbi:hypothetical protein [Spiroplasma sp. BIUS-1]|uniref:hypothetical protein n=1 Tax=Spiroplasma sp. BIUS-1 TaxID=216964 RepID=UPI001396F4BE|nr:hypothetical protein [Spiroplasma sp. BIUS-1]QHX36570.1 hypothetical protein SBIUS_v1c03170 [Spiroplasma sp. BIUS-1]
MSEKVYQLNSDQIGVVNFPEPWFLVHFEVEGEVEPFQQFFPSLAEGIQKFPTVFEEKVINHWLSQGAEGQKKLRELKDYLISTWMNPGIETMREAMFQTYGHPEFREKTGLELIESNNDFLAVVIGHICLRYNKSHFYFKGLHIAGKTVDKMLAVNFWSKVKQEAMNDIGTTIFK